MNFVGTLFLEMPKHCTECHLSGLPDVCSLFVSKFGNLERPFLYYGGLFRAPINFFSGTHR